MMTLSEIFLIAYISFLLLKRLYYILASPISYLAKYRDIYIKDMSEYHVKKCANKRDGRAKLLSVFFQSFSPFLCRCGC